MKSSYTLKHGVSKEQINLLKYFIGKEIEIRFNQHKDNPQAWFKVKLRDVEEPNSFAIWGFGWCRINKYEFRIKEGVGLKNNLCEQCEVEQNGLCTEAHDNVNNIHFTAKSTGICKKCKKELGFVSLKEIENRLKQKEVGIPLELESSGILPKTI